MLTSLTLIAGIMALLLVSARRDPLPGIAASSQPGFSICALPCWAGLHPRETRFEDAIKLIIDNLREWRFEFGANNNQLTFSAQAGETPLAGTVYEDRGYVGGMLINAAFPQWMLLQELGRPYCVRTSHIATTDQETVVLYWRLEGLFILGISQIGPDDWKLGSKTTALYIVASDDVCELPDAMPWRGFMPIWRYNAVFN